MDSRTKEGCLGVRQWGRGKAGLKIWRKRRPWPLWGSSAGPESTLTGEVWAVCGIPVMTAVNTGQLAPGVLQIKAALRRQ